MWELHVHHGGQRGHQHGYEPVGVGAVGAVDQVHRRQLDVHLLAGDPLQHVGQALVVRVQLDLAGTVKYVVPVRGKLKEVFSRQCKMYYMNRKFSFTGYRVATRFSDFFPGFPHFFQVFESSHFLA